MNRMASALVTLGEMDDLAARSSPIHRRHAIAKLLSTVGYIAVVLSFPKYALAALTPMVLWPVLLYRFSGVPMGACFRKLRYVLPLVLAVGLFNPLFDRATLLYLGGVAVSGGVVSMLTLMLKGVLCLMASFLLMATTSIDCLCAALRSLRVPELPVTLLLLTYRYTGVLVEEVAVMTDAYHLRAPEQKGIHVSAWGSFLGQLLLRSMDRARELYDSMVLRGYHGHFHYAPVGAFTAGDGGYLAACLGAFLLLRLVDVTGWLGGLLVR